MSRFDLQSKRAIITGGSSGIGEAIADVFMESGAEVHVLDISKSESQQHQFQYHICDITDLDQVREAVAQIADGGSIDILVNNAGIAHIGNAGDTTQEDFEKVMNVNVHGAFHCINACLQHMITAGSGVILNIASTVASLAIANRFAYMTSKGAILSMTYSVARDYVDKGIRCNAISPGRVHTPFVDGFIAENYPGREAEMYEKLSADHPIGRMAQPHEIAYLALYLCSDEAAYVTGSNHQIDGGFTNLKI